MIDVNVHLGQWPFQRLPYDDAARLVKKLKAAGIEQAWAGSFEALLHEDVAGVNLRLTAACREQGEGFLLPFGVVNPKLPDWQEDLRRCHEDHQMPGIRLYPNYHRYLLADAECLELLKAADKRKLIVQIAIKMEDERTQHPLVAVPPVDVKPLLNVLPDLPGLRIVLLNALRNVQGELLGQLAHAGRVSFDFAMLEGVGGLEKLIKLLPFERLLFGSHAPLFNLESALLKLRESDLGDFIRQHITQKNAQALLT